MMYCYKNRFVFVFKKRKKYKKAKHFSCYKFITEYLKEIKTISKQSIHNIKTEPNS